MSLLRFLHTPEQIVQQLLIDLGTCIAPGGINRAEPWAAYYSGEPDEAEKCVTVFGTQGRDFGRTVRDGERQEHHGIQVRVRAGDHDDAHAKAREIADALDQRVYGATVTLDDNTYRVFSFNRTGAVIPLGKDVPNTKRSLFTLNGTAVIRRMS